jgi:DHA2 family multidrug resistance protein-like MFS transporter
MCVNTALIRFIYPHSQLGRGIGLNAMIIAIASAIGPSIAAAILAVSTWPLLFAVNIPLGGVALGIAFKTLPRTPQAARRFDAASALLSAATFGLLIATINGFGHDLSRLTAAAMLLAALACGALLVRRQRAQAAPLLPLDLLRIPVFALSICTSLMAFAGQMLAFVALPFYIQNTLGRSEVQTGLLLTPWPLGIAIASPIAGRISDRVPAGLLGGIGLLLQAAGLFLLTRLPARPETASLAWRLALCGIGFGLFQTPNNRTMLSAAPRNRSGAASGMLSTARLLGQSCGAALVAAIFGLTVSSGPITAIGIAAVFALVAAGVSVIRLRK